MFARRRREASLIKTPNILQIPKSHKYKTDDKLWRDDLSAWPRALRGPE